MNYTSQKLNCKALIGAILSIVVALSLSTRAYAAYSMRLIPNFLFDDKRVYVAENISPRSSTLSSVTISYDSLADLVYYCNEHGLSTTLAYNSALSVYVGFVSDDALSVKKFRLASLHGLLGSVDGKVYVAERKDSGGGTVNNTYNYNQTIINPPSVAPSTTPRPGGTVSSVVTDRELQERIYHSVDSLYQYMSLIIDWLRFVDQDICRIYKQLDGNVVPALEAINNNIISFKDSAVSTLRTVCSVLSDSYDVQFNLLGVVRSIYSSVSGIGSRLDSVITNGEVQINTTPLEARLDKLISMYSKVNAVVLDTAAINGSQINDAVGGELEDVMFWGSSLKSGGQFVYADPLAYTLNGVVEPVANIPLRGMVLGTSIPSTIDDTDAVLMAGVWQGPNGKYYVSDTYNAITGEYVQRLRSITYDGSEGWKMTAKSDGMNMFWYRDKSIEDVSGGRDAMASAGWLGYKNYDSTFYNQANAAAASKNKFTLAGQAFRIVVSADDYPDVASWTSYLSANPLTFFYVLSAPTDSGAAVDLPVVTMLDPVAIAIPEGDSTISAFRARITGKYETYDSYTQTADIISAIDRLQVGVAPDLDPIVTRLDTLISQSSDTVVNVVNNNTYITNVYQLDDENDVADRSKEGIEKIGGMFKWLWKHAFKDAFGAADVSKLDGLL